jgi:hypothetical protein
MLEGLSLEIIASGVAGLLIAGAALRAAIRGYAEGRQQASQVGANAAAMVSAVAIGFEKDQRDKIVHCVERIAAALEVQNKHLGEISESQAAQADRQRQDMDDKLNELLKKVGVAEREQRQTPLPRRPGGPR